MTEPSKPRQAGMAFILLTLFIDILGIGVIIPVLPELVKEFVGGDAETDVASRYYAAISASYAMMQFLCAPIMGALSDRFGRRPILLAALFGLGIDYLIQGFAPTIWWLFAGRVLAGIMGASFPAANAYIADVSTPDTRARNYGLMGVMFGLGFICGPALGGVLGSYSLRLPFFVSAGLALLNWLYGYFILPESHPPENRSSFTWAKANPFGTLGRLRKYSLVAGLALAFLCMSLAQRGLENVWVLFCSFRFGWGEMTNGLMLGLVGVTAAVVQGGLVRPMTRRLGERTTLLFGLSIASLAFVGYGLASEGWMIKYIIIFGSLAGVSGPALQSLVAGVVPSSEQGKIQGALTSLQSLTAIFAPILFTGGLFGYFTSERAPIILPGAPFLVGAVLWLAALIICARVFAKIPAQPSEVTGEPSDETWEPGDDGDKTLGESTQPTVAGEET